MNLLQRIQHARPNSIGIFGKARAGKDSIAQLLAEALPNYTRMAYAAPLHKVVHYVFPDTVYLDNKKHEALFVDAATHACLTQALVFTAKSLDVPPALLFERCAGLLNQRSITPRQVMQSIGSAVRSINPTAFITKVQKHNKIIVSDCRFPNEMLDFNVLVLRDVPALQDISEAGAAELEELHNQGRLKNFFVVHNNYPSLSELKAAILGDNHVY